MFSANGAGQNFASIAVSRRVGTVSPEIPPSHWSKSPEWASPDCARSSCVTKRGNGTPPKKKVARPGSARRTPKTCVGGQCEQRIAVSSSGKFESERITTDDTIGAVRLMRASAEGDAPGRAHSASKRCGIQGRSRITSITGKSAVSRTDTEPTALEGLDGCPGLRMSSCSVNEIRSSRSSSRVSRPMVRS
eukprot:Amastigsp_a8600_9.p2 type:complete len:191 gc:universal Amastigsp_a8600_9:776-204(-)